MSEACHPRSECRLSGYKVNIRKVGRVNIVLGKSRRRGQHIVYLRPIPDGQVGQQNWDCWDQTVPYLPAALPLWLPHLLRVRRTASNPASRVRALIAILGSISGWVWGGFLKIIP
jgi:hypothetical protein